MCNHPVLFTKFMYILFKNVTGACFSVFSPINIAGRMRRGEVFPLTDWCTVTQGVEEIQHFVTSAADKVSHHAKVPTACADADPGSPPQVWGVSQASQPTAATGITGWGNSWHNLAGFCASVNIVFIFLNMVVSVLVGWMRMTHTE